MSLAARACTRALRASSVRPAVFGARRWNSAAASTDPKINSIVDEISGLTLLQTAELVSTLKVGPEFVLDCN